MTREEIAALAKDTKDKNGLLLLLNIIRDDIMRDKDGIVHGYPFTIQQINYYCNPNHVKGRYRQFQIKKKTGGFRTITAPKNQTYKLMLKCIDILLKSLYKPSAYAMGFIEGRSIVSNASLHTGKNYVFNIDLKDFFPSISQARVWKRLQIPPFEFSQPVANIIAGICCMKETKADEEGVIETVYVLPQGSPASPIITNMICDKLDHRLAGLAKRFNLTYSRYADDITFSSSHNVYNYKGEFHLELCNIIQGQNFRQNFSKTRLQEKGARQEVTGIVVNTKLNVMRKYVRDIRNILYIWERYGYEQAYAKFFVKYKSDKGHIKHGNPDMINVIDGKLQYLKMVKGEADAVYQRLYFKFCALANKITGNNTGMKGITFLHTYSISDFEKTMNTTVQISLIKPDADKEKPAIIAQFSLSEQNIDCRISSKIDSTQQIDKQHLFISLCNGKDGDEFWLLHHKHQDYQPQTLESQVNIVDIDELNRELDSLLT